MEAIVFYSPIDDRASHNNFKSKPLQSITEHAIKKNIVNTVKEQKKVYT